MNPTPPSSDSFLRIDAAAAADGRGVAVGPVSVLINRSDGAMLVAIGTPAEVSSHPSSGRAEVVACGGSLLLPALVNAHTHLDLTHIGPRPFERARGFGGFVELVRHERLSDWDDVFRSARVGRSLSKGGGVLAVGDIAGATRGRPSTAAAEAFQFSDLAGVSFLEFFAVGKGEGAARTFLTDLVPSWKRADDFLAARRKTGGARVARLGFQPHAPSTVSVATYEWLLKQSWARGCPLSTHLAETPEEHEFIGKATGPQRGFLEALGLWEDRMLEEIGQGRTPVAHMSAVLRQAPFLCAHVNDCSDGDLAILAKTPSSVAYCPRASDYFAAHEHFGSHRYRDMLAAGINVCLGTDSIINLPAGTDRLSTLDEARFLYQRDGADPVTLLKMATINGAKALGLNEDTFAFKVGSRLAGLVAVPFEPRAGLTPLAAALTSNSAPELLLIGK